MAHPRATHQAWSGERRSQETSMTDLSAEYQALAQY
ncbi:MAG: hypothetical protein RL655_2288, partial [Pseudomonadota bacterium]